MNRNSVSAQLGWLLAALLSLVWLYVWLDWQYFKWFSLESHDFLCYVALLPVAWGFWRARRKPALFRYATCSACLFPIWHLVVFKCERRGWETLEAVTSQTGLVIIFIVGLAWTVWLVDRQAQRFQVTRFEASAPTQGPGPLLAMHASMASAEGGRRIWNPVDMDAWFYGKRKPKLYQSLSVFFGYLVTFLAIFLLLINLTGCEEAFALPSGGGEEAPLQPMVKIQKIIKKKFVLNPYSSVYTHAPNETQLQLLEITKHAYKAGSGEGAGAGFSSGNSRGKVHFIRLEYSGGDWDQGIDADENMLMQYHLLTQHKVADEPQTRTISQVKNFKIGESPPLLYLTGQKNINVGRGDVEILRAYLLEKQGMLFADNGGSAHWGNQFKALMGRVLPNISYSRVPLDHPIHRVPYPIPFLPYVAPHGGTDALAWVVDGRIAAYYHPGDIGDAWADDHAGVPTPIWEACYQLGTNIIFYAHAEYNKWLDSRKKSD